MHELLDNYPIAKMLELHEEKYPYLHDRQLIIQNFTNFEKADEDFNPQCFRGKYWEVIKADFVDEMDVFRK
ncbi:hypothetical protein FACS1894177_05720 [Bacteroidia bacterium]|nr:hypothetical protein FACS1894177_05720 [Bacteroidia bacterium]